MKYLCVIHIKPGEHPVVKGTTISQEYLRDKINKDVDVCDIRNLFAMDITKYNVICLHYFCFLVRNNFDYEFMNRVKIKLQEAKKVCLFLHDIHPYTFKNRYTDARILQQPANIKNKVYGQLYTLCKDFRVEYILSNYSDCPEMDLITVELSDLIKKIDYIDLHVNTEIFKDYFMEKDIDIFVYGASIMGVYPLRHKIKTALKNRTNTALKVHFIEFEDKISGVELAKLINRSWITIATHSKYFYLVQKYFEISACCSVVAGNMPKRGDQIWGPNYIDLSLDMTPEEIVQKLADALNDKEQLKSYIKNMYHIIHTEYNYDTLGAKFMDIMQSFDDN